MYVETVLANDSYAKEVKLFGLGPRFLARYKAIFDKLYVGDRQITIRRAIWALILGTVGTLAFYGMYLWIAIATIDATLSAGEFIMYAGVFKAAQSAMSSALGDIGGMYEDNLYLSNLYEFLDTRPLSPGRRRDRAAARRRRAGSRACRSRTRARASGRCRRSICTSRRARSSRSSARTAAARPR
jgi:hypothetical protein